MEPQTKVSQMTVRRKRQAEMVRARPKVYSPQRPAWLTQYLGELQAGRWLLYLDTVTRIGSGAGYNEHGAGSLDVITGAAGNR